MEAHAGVLEAHPLSSKLILELQKLPEVVKASKLKFPKTFTALRFCGQTNKMEK
jgi:hypothetical protein